MSQLLRDPTAAVRGTDNDAATSRLSACELGYLSDPFARHTVSRPTRRPPLINIGTHARTWAVDALLDSFLSSSSSSSNATAQQQKQKQVLSLGAGSDTRFWRYHRSKPELAGRVKRWVELDLEESTASKVQLFKRREDFHPALGDFRSEQGGAALTSDQYRLLPCDLHTFVADVAPRLVADGTLDPSLDTLLLAECVFIYLPPSVTQPILQWTASTFSRAAAVWYDPANLTDAFGRMMVNNLLSRRIELQGAAETDQIARLEAAGFQKTNTASILAIRKQYIPQDELDRISKPEMLDEIEELELVLSHYAVSWGSTGSEEPLLSLIPSQP